MTLKEIEIDMKLWNKFLDKISTILFKNNVSILIAPYGEALIHSYYTRGIAYLTKQKQIKIVSCQTNISWDVTEWLELLMNNGANLNKIKLWCTYHPEMDELKNFVEKIKFLNKYIDLCVGVVGDPDSIDEIGNLRRALPLNIYLWINKMDGLGRNYKINEINEFKKIDPLFKLELERFNVENICTAGKNHYFINGKGDLFNCNRFKKVVGNLYNDIRKEKNTNCKKKICDCYLAYSHLADIKELNLFEDQKLVRLPKRKEVKAIFLDVDGTVLNKKGIIEFQTKIALEYLSKKIPIYLMTQLPYDRAMKKCNTIAKLLSGGCFANGAHIVEKKNNLDKYYYLKDIPKSKYSKRKYIYSNLGKAYKVMIIGDLNKIEIEKNCYEVTQERDRLSIVAKAVNKLQGVTHICGILGLSLNEVMAIGNSSNDLEVIKNVEYSVAVPDASYELKKAARYVLSIHHIPYII